MKTIYSKQIRILISSSWKGLKLWLKNLSYCIEITIKQDDILIKD